MKSRWLPGKSTIRHSPMFTDVPAVSAHKHEDGNWGLIIQDYWRLSDFKER